jgi:hypothetical protein
MSADSPFIEALRQEIVDGVRRAERRPTRLRRASILSVVATLVVFGLVLPMRTLLDLRAEDNPGTTSHPGAPSGTFPAEFNVTEFHLESGITGVAAGFGSVWVVAPQQILRVDSATGQIAAAIPFSGDVYGSVAVSPDAVWASGGGAEIVKLDPATNKISMTVSAGGNVHALLADEGSIWASTSSNGGQLVGFREADGTPIGRIQAPVGPLQLSAGAILVLSPSPVVVNPKNLAVKPLNIHLPGSAVADDGSFWSIAPSTADATNNRVERIDPESGDVLASLEIPRAGALSADSAGIWVLSVPGSKSDEVYIPDPSQPAFVTLIDPGTNEPISDRISVDRTPAEISAANGTLWITHFDTGVLTKIERSGA